MNPVVFKRIFKVLAILMVTGLLWPVPASAQVAFRAVASASVPSTGLTYASAGAAAVVSGCPTTISPPLPAGTVTGDMLIALVSSKDSNAITMAGWNTLFAQNPVATYQSRIFWRIATGADPNTISKAAGAGCNVMIGRISRFTGVDTVNPFESVFGAGNWSYQNAGTVTTGTENTVNSNTMLIIAAHTADNSNLTSTPAGFTLQWESLTATGSDVSIALLTRQETAAGVKGAFVMSKNRGADPNHGVLFALRPAGLRIAVPATTAVNDVMIASIAARPCSATSGAACTTDITPPAGWTLVNFVNQTTGGGTGGFGNILYVYWRVATAADIVPGTTYAWTFGGTPVNAGAAGAISSFSGVDTASPVVVDAGQATPNAFTHTAPSINTGAVTNTMLVSSHAANSAASWTPPPGMTEAADQSSLAVPNTLGIALEVNYELRAAAGATGTRTATQSNPPASDTGAAHMLALRPGISVNHYAVSVLSTSVANCDFAEVTITAHSATHAAVNPPAARTVTLSTSVGTGVWQPTLVSGAGTWTPSGLNNGAATYQWTGTESSFTVRLRQSAVTSLSINLLDNAAITELGTEDPTISFANSALRISTGANAALSVGPQIAGKASNVAPGSQNLFLQAIRTDTTTGACTSLFPSGADVAIQVGAQCNNPATCTQNVTLTTTSPVGNSGSFVPNGAFPATINFRFTTASAEAPFLFSYADAGQITLQFRAALPSPPAGVFVSGTSNAFVVRPFGFYLSGAGIPGVTGPGGAVFKKAGENFNVTVAAVAWQAGDDANNDGVPDSGANLADNAVLPNFGQETVPENVTVSHVLVAPAGGSPGAITGGSFTAFSGGAKTNVMTWSEVGSIALNAALTSGNFLSSGFNVSGSVSPVGRFRPDHFLLTSPVLINRRALACAPASTFTYEGEEMRATFLLTARNGLATPTTTTNYTTASSFAKLDGTVPANFAFGAVDLADATPPLGATALTGRLTLGTSSGTWVGGSGNFTADLAVSRATPDGPFESFQLGAIPADADGVTLRAADLNLDTDVPTNGADRVLVGSSKIRFGRLMIGNANGSSALPLPVRLEAQYWNGNAFVTNTPDNCTPIAASVASSNINMTNYTAPLTDTPKCLTALSGGGTLTSGRLTLQLAPPNTSGSVDLTVNLGASASGNNTCLSAGASPTAETPANRIYLRSGSGFAQNPSARATFGIFRGSEEIIFIRENF